MSKIKINLDYTPVNGKQISFTAPCSSYNCEELIIDGVEYVPVDADGVSVAGKSNVWNTGAMVSIIVDTVNQRAYVQNANTNSYLEEKIKQNTGVQIVVWEEGD